ncbi:glutathione S-transferase family protein [Salmonella enterica]|nr:glutathione S-transferase family protein [Salmonella enterica]ELL6162433.1 glutathione S-transferase family protein [Salmonella enterica]
MSYTLFYSPGAASFAVHWMLFELKTPFTAQLVDIESGNQRSPEYLSLNPVGRVPALIVDGKPVTESTAILMLLAERHPESGLAPKPDTPERAEWLELMIYMANTLLPSMRDWFYADKDGSPEDADAIRTLARSRIEEACEYLDKRLANQQTYLVGDRLTTVDLLATMLMRWTRNMPTPAMQWPHLASYIYRMRELPSFLQTHNQEKLEGWLNS